MKASLLVGLAACAARAQPAPAPVAAQAPPPPPTAPAEPAPDDTGIYNGLIAEGSADDTWSSPTPGPTVAVGQPTSNAALDKAIIRRYVKHDIQKIQACYENELNTTPKLAGTLTVTFLIDRDGTVASASASGLGNANVETCVAAVIKAIVFPKPKGGGSIQVNYPFTFRPA